MIVDEKLAKTGLFVEPSYRNSAAQHMQFFADMLKDYVNPAVWFESNKAVHPGTGETNYYTRMWIREVGAKNV